MFAKTDILRNSHNLHMSQIRKRYKQWQRNPNIPIPKRTLARLKKKARTDAVRHAVPTSDMTFTDSSELSEDCNGLPILSSERETQTIEDKPMKGRETSVSDSSACVSDSANEDNFYRDQDELANSELYFCTSYLMMKISTVPCLHVVTQSTILLKKLMRNHLGPQELT